MLDFLSNIWGALQNPGKKLLIFVNRFFRRVLRCKSGKIWNCNYKRHFKKYFPLNRKTEVDIMKKIICVFLVLVAIMLTACSNNDATDKLSVVKPKSTSTEELSNLKVYYGDRISDAIEIPTYKTYEASHDNACHVKSHNLHYESYKSYFFYLKEEITKISAEAFWTSMSDDIREYSIYFRKIDKNLWRAEVLHYMYHSSVAYITLKLETSDGAIHWMTWIH